MSDPINLINLENPWKLPEEWTELNPWDIINCLKCDRAWKVPEHIYQLFNDNNLGCPICTFLE